MKNSQDIPKALTFKGQASAALEMSISSNIIVIIILISDSQGLNPLFDSYQSYTIT